MVAICTIEKVQSFGGKVVACSDRSGHVTDQNGVDPALLEGSRDVRRERICQYVRRRGDGAPFVPAETGCALPGGDAFGHAERLGGQGCGQVDLDRRDGGARGREPAKPPEAIKMSGVI